MRRIQLTSAILVTALLLFGKVPRAWAQPPGCDGEQVWDDEFASLSGNGLSNLQVTIEVRFITVSDQFFEKIGVDFDIDLNNAPCAPDLVPPQQQFPDPNATNTALNPFRQPNFFGLPETAEVHFGIAFLSDIESFLFLKAARADATALIRNAPPLTIFNGQVCSFGDPAIQPLFGNALVEPGLLITVQPVISADRRFVKLDLQPVLTGVTLRDTFSTLGGAVDNQPGNPDAQPQFPAIFPALVASTVSVPDGGTVLLGGLLRERQLSDDWAPVLNKVPFYKRLFRNSLLTPSHDSLVIMVTPTVLIQD